jgi:hypothetical protein
MCCDKIQKITTTINKSKNKKSSLSKEECIYAFVNFLINKQTEIPSVDLFFDMLNKFIERLKQKKIVINEKKTINKLYEFNINNEFTGENSLDTLIDHIFTE